VIERRLPGGVLDEQRLDVGGVGGREQLRVARADEMRRVALGVAVRRDRADAGGELGLAVDGLDVLPVRERGLDALGEAAARAGDRVDRLQPPLELGRRDDDLGLREVLLVVFLGHQAAHVVAL